MTAWTNKKLDRRLSEVALPDGLLPRLHALIPDNGTPHHPNGTPHHPEVGAIESNHHWTGLMRESMRNAEATSADADRETWDAEDLSQLRNVQLPEDFLPRLHEDLTHAIRQDERLLDERLLDERLLDERLLDVRVPDRALLRCHLVELEEELLGDNAPEALGASAKPGAERDGRGKLLSRRGHASWSIPRLRDMAVAACLVLLLATSYGSAVVWLVRDSLAPGAGRAELAVGDDWPWMDGGARPVQLVAAPYGISGPESEEIAVTPAAISEQLSIDRSQDLFVSQFLELSPEPYSVEPADWQVALLADPPGTTAAVSDIQQTLADGMQPWQDVFTLRYDYLGYPVAPRDILPRMTPPPQAWEGGLEPPESGGFNRAFFLKYGHYPWVRPSLDVPLRTVSLPLCWDPSSYEAALRRTKQGRRLDPEDVILDEWLAALSYPVVSSREVRKAAHRAQQYVQSEPPFAWSWSGGPSPFGVEGTQLLHVSLQALAERASARPATHLTWVLDRSAAMNTTGAQGWIDETVGRVGPLLHSEDRISCITFNEIVSVVAESARPEHLAWVEESLEARQPEGGTDVAAGLFRAVPIAMWGPEPDASRQMVVVTDGRLSLPDSVATALLDVMELAAAEGLQLLVINVDPTGQADALWKQLVRRTGGRMVAAHSANDAYRAIGELVLGHPPIVGTDVRLTVQFDPQQVRAYRVVGPGPTSLGGLQSAREGSEVLSGETSAVLWELNLAPGAGGPIGNARLEWTARDGTLQTRRIRLDRRIVASSFEESAPALQVASLVAEAGAILAESPFAEAREHTLGRVMMQAEKASLQLSSWKPYREFLQLVRDCRQLGGERGH